MRGRSSVCASRSSASSRAVSDVRSRCPVARRSTSPSVMSGASRAVLLQRTPPLLRLERLGEVVEPAGEHLLEVQGHLHAVVGDAAVRIVVGADLLGTVARADLRLAGGGELGLAALP